MRLHHCFVFAATLATAMFVFAATASAQEPTSCSTNHPVMQAHFVWGVAADDPDGGLVMRASPGVGSRQIGVLAADEGRVWPTGNCWVSPSGSTWYEIWAGDGRDQAWVSSNFLRPTQPSCLFQAQVASDGQIVLAGGGHAISDGDRVAFLSYGDPGRSYRIVDASNIVLANVACPPRNQLLPPPLPTLQRSYPQLVVCG